VVSPSAEAAARDRYSIAFFVNPDREVVIAAHPRTVGGGLHVSTFQLTLSRFWRRTHPRNLKCPLTPPAYTQNKP